MKQPSPGIYWDVLERQGVVFAPAAVMIAVTVAAAAMTAMSQIQQGQQQKALGDYNAEVQKQAGIQAQDAAEANAQRSESRASQLLASQKAAFAAGGVDADAGTPLDVMSDTAAQTKLDAMTIRYGGTVAADRANSQAGLDTLQGEGAQSASYLKAGSSLLSGAARAYAGYGGSTTDTGLIPGSAQPMTMGYGSGATSIKY